jgi:uncharacterized ferritin-like protein (DUF455 family)
MKCAVWLVVVLPNAFYPKGLFGPFNLDARQHAGFTDDEMALMIGG